MSDPAALALALTLSAVALPLAAAAACAAAFAYWTGRGRIAESVLDRAADLERGVMSAVQALSGRLEASEATVRSLAGEAAEAFDRAERARKRADRDVSRAASALEGEPKAETAPTDRAGTLRLVAAALSAQGM